MGKIVQVDKLQAIGASVRLMDAQVVWTNGCFDLLHIGHVRSLFAASRFGILVVGVNSDESVRRLKPGRPIIPAHERAEMLAAISRVNYVVIFPEADACHCIDLLRPEVICKGEEYRGRPMPERDLALSYGGRIEYLPFVSGISTTAIIQRAREATDEHQSYDRAGGHPRDRQLPDPDTIQSLPG